MILSDFDIHFYFQDDLPRFSNTKLSPDLTHHFRISSYGPTHRSPGTKSDISSLLSSASPERAINEGIHGPTNSK